MEVVANASPLIGLANINKFFLLKELFTRVYIPEAVYQEVVIDGEGKAGADETKKGLKKEWIKKKSISDVLAVEALSGLLGDGEAEAIVLAKELNIEMILLDDLGARDEAHLLRLKVTGTIGILQLAAKKGFSIDLRKELDALRDKEFRISDDLYQKILKKPYSEILP